MVKVFLIIFVIIAIFTGALYLGIFELLGLQIDTFKSDFISFIPIELRLAFFLLVLGIIIGVGKTFID